MHLAQLRLKLALGYARGVLRTESQSFEQVRPVTDEEIIPNIDGPCRRLPSPVNNSISPSLPHLVCSSIPSPPLQSHLRSIYLIAHLPFPLPSPLRRSFPT